jgi:organic hydroperoxide reductase OsmC/OhrA
VRARCTATATATDAGRNGRTRTDEGRFDPALPMPESIGGLGGESRGPE